MNIAFEPLSESHFPLLLKWLETKHVKAWWNDNITWTLPLIKEKYSSYVKGYKLYENVAKEIYAYILTLDDNPIGYIQYYNKYDFYSVKYDCLSFLPKNCASFDYYIGEDKYIRKGIGSKALSLFLEQYVFKKFDYVVVDPDVENTQAIGAYKKAGFKVVEELHNSEILLMIKEGGEKQ